MKKYWLAFLPLLVWACSNTQQAPSEKIASSTEGMVVAGHPLASEAGRLMLEKGGNAADAAVAAGFALAVVEPSMSGIGGRLMALVRSEEGEVHGIDATTQAPMLYDTATAPNVSYGYPTIGIPGVVAGLTKILEDHGTLSLAEVMAPAIRYAEEGFTLLKGEALRHSLQIDEIREFEGTSKYYLDGDTTYVEGSLLVQQDLANTLKTIATEGKDAFYKGSIAREIVSDLQKNGSVMTLEDLAAYEAEDRMVLSGNYRGYDLNAMWMPSFGAITIEILNILEQLPMSDLSEADWVTAFYQAIKLAYDDRDKQTSDSMAMVLSSKEYAQTLFPYINLESNNNPATGHLSPQPEQWKHISGHTTHLSASDKNGMTVSLTQSLGPNMGSRVASPGLGFLYAVTLGRYLGVFDPGQRAASHISPFIVTKDGKPFLVLGAAGGSLIIPAVVEVVSRVIDQGMPLDQALAAPRIYFQADSMLVETHEGINWDPASFEEITSEGFFLKNVNQPARFGRVHAIQFDAGTKVWTGCADPDWEGTAAKPRQ